MRKNRTDLGKVVGTNLKRLIKESEYRTQANFAYAFGADERTVRRWVSGKIDKLSIIDQIADFFMIDSINLLSEREGVFVIHRTKHVLTLFKNPCYNNLVKGSLKT